MRCYKCDGCISSSNEFRPEWCKDDKCPQGKEESEAAREARTKILDMIFGVNQPQEGGNE